jgi:hypothetical protein
MQLTPQQKRFFSDFGYLFLPGLMADDIDWIIDEFEAVFRDNGVVHDGTKRSSIGPFIDQRARLCTLLDDPRIEGLIGGLLGEGFNYLGSSGELYVGGGLWHSDSAHRILTYVKLAMYLDPLTRDTGALRVVPGSHKQDWVGNLDPVALWDITPNEVPSVALENQPGDVVVFHESLLHNAIRGGSRRRMLNLVCCSRARTKTEMPEVDQRVVALAGRPLYSDFLRQTASPARMRHLEQILERQAALTTRAFH